MTDRFLKKRLQAQWDVLRRLTDENALLKQKLAEEKEARRS
jgi:hypothetical protein